MLLAGLQREDEAALAVEVGRLSDDATGHAPDEVRARGKEAVVRTAVALRVAHALALADRHVAAVRTGSFENAERCRIDVRDGERSRLAGGCGKRGRVLEAAEEVRLREDHRCSALRGRGDACRVRDALRMTDLDHLEAEPGRIGLDDLPHLGVERLGEHDPRPARSRAWR